MTQFDYSLINSGEDNNVGARLGAGLGGVLDFFKARKENTILKENGGDFQKTADAFRERGDSTSAQKYQELADDELKRKLTQGQIQDAQTEREVGKKANNAYELLMQRMGTGKEVSPATYTPGAEIPGAKPQLPEGASLPTGVEGPVTDVPSPLVSQAPMREPGTRTEAVTKPYTNEEQLLEITQNPEIMRALPMAQRLDAFQKIQELMVKNKAATKRNPTDAELKQVHLSDALGRLRQKYGPQLETAFSASPEAGGTMARKLISSDPAFAGDQDVLLDWTTNAFKRETPTVADLWQMTINKEGMQGKREDTRYIRETDEKLAGAPGSSSGFGGVFNNIENIAGLLKDPNADKDKIVASAVSLKKLIDSSQVTGEEMKTLLSSLGVGQLSDWEAQVRALVNNSTPEVYRQKMIEQTKIIRDIMANSYQNQMDIAKRNANNPDFEPRLSKQLETIKNLNFEREKPKANELRVPPRKGQKSDPMGLR